MEEYCKLDFTYFVSWQAHTSSPMYGVFTSGRSYHSTISRTYQPFSSAVRTFKQKILFKAILPILSPPSPDVIVFSSQETLPMM